MEGRAVRPRACGGQWEKAPSAHGSGLAPAGHKSVPRRSRGPQRRRRPSAASSSPAPGRCHALVPDLRGFLVRGLGFRGLAVMGSGSLEEAHLRRPSEKGNGSPATGAVPGAECVASSREALAHHLFAANGARLCHMAKATITQLLNPAARLGPARSGAPHDPARMRVFSPPCCLASPPARRG